MVDSRLRGPIVLCVGEHWSASCVYHAIRDVGVTHVISEAAPSPQPVQSFHEVVVQSYVRTMTPLMRRTSRARIDTLMTRFPLRMTPIPKRRTVTVASVGDAKTMKWLKRLDPALVILFETQPLAEDVLQRIACPVLTMRPTLAVGQLASYWAFRRRTTIQDVTIERWTPKGWTIVDRALLHAGGSDNFTTYPYLQLVTGVPLLIRQIEACFQDEWMEQRNS